MPAGARVVAVCALLAAVGAAKAKAKATPTLDDEEEAFSVLLAAVREDEPEAVRRALEAGAPIDARGQGGQTALMTACLSGKAFAARALLEAGADVSIGERDGYTCAHGVGFQGRAELVPVLEQQRVPLSELHADGYAPIHRACWGRTPRHAFTVEALVKAGVDPELPSADGKTPAELAAHSPMTVAVLEKAVAAKRKNKAEL